MNKGKERTEKQNMQRHRFLNMKLMLIIVANAYSYFCRKYIIAFSGNRS